MHNHINMPNPVAMRSEAQVCKRLTSRVKGSNHAKGMDGRVYCVLRR